MGRNRGCNGFVIEGIRLFHRMHVYTVKSLQDVRSTVPSNSINYDSISLDSRHYVTLGQVEIAIDVDQFVECCRMLGIKLKYDYLNQ